MTTRKPPASRNSDPAAVDFEASLAKLENLVSRMEQGDMSLEASLKAFEEGVRLTRLCQETLARAQQKVQVLMQQQGTIALEPMAADDHADDDAGDNKPGTTAA